jgi:hypothetical protein
MFVEKFRMKSIHRSGSYYQLELIVLTVEESVYESVLWVGFVAFFGDFYCRNHF